MTRPGEALSEFDLLTHVWDENANPLTRTVRVTVMTLRRKLAGNPIETVQGAGYRLQGGRVSLTSLTAFRSRPAMPGSAEGCRRSRHSSRRPVRPYCSTGLRAASGGSGT